MSGRAASSPSPRRGLDPAWTGTRYLDVWFLALMICALVIVFWIVSPGWLNPRTIPAVVAQNTPLALVAMAMTFAIISRNIDLSPGSALALSGVVGGLAFRATGSVEAAVIATLLAAVGVSLLNGILVAGLGLSAIMVTLAAYVWERGLALAFTRGDPIPVGGWLTDLMTSSVGGVTITAPLVIGIYVAGWWMLRRTRFGRATYAVGGDPAAARRARIDVRRTTLLVFVMMGLMVGIGSVVVMGQLASAQPYVASQLALDAIIAVVIGGTRLMGGEGSVGRTALGLAFVAILNSGLLNLGLQDAWYQLVKGSVLLMVLTVQISLRRMAAVSERHQLELQAAAGGVGG